MRKRISRPPVWRQHVVVAGMLAGLVVIGLRVIQIQTVEQGHLQAQGDARYLREITVLPERGRILDRNGQVLAVSTPVDSLWADPKVFCKSAESWKPMLETLGLKSRRLKASCERRADADFMYVKRRLPPAVAKEVMAMAIPGIEIQREYRRYYPGGPVGAHLVGFTDVDDRGQEGLERVWDKRLTGEPGRKRVLKDLAGNYVESLESIQQVKHGEDITISIDQRVQSLASSYLEQAVRKYQAAGGSVVVLGVPSGEIIAMVNSPQFNPNDRSTFKKGVFRNRAVTDTLEPGSTSKPFTVAMALESGEVGVNTLVDTAPGWYRVGGHTIRDVHNYGEISVFDVVVHSSNIGTTKLAMAFPFQDLYRTLQQAGFGTRASNLPGEISGSLVKRSRPIEHATYSYGYGFSATPLQLARAYTVLASDGRLLPVTLEPRPAGYEAKGSRVFATDTVEAIRQMLEQVATREGTARKARVPRYRIGGKTGTSHKLIDGNYRNKRYMSSFVGMAPITEPSFIIVVTIDDPRGKHYYGGDVAAPVFSRLMQDLLRLYNVRPDDISKPEDDSQITALQKSGDPA